MSPETSFRKSTRLTAPMHMRRRLKAGGARGSDAMPLAAIARYDVGRLDKGAALVEENLCVCLRASIGSCPAMFF